MLGGNLENQAQTERLLAAVAEQLKMPLMQIARNVELADQASLGEASLAAERGLKLIDSYLLATQQQSLELEPVSVSSVLYDVMDDLSQLASRHHCELQLSVSGKYGPVMANAPALEAALVSLGQAFISTPTEANKSSLTFAVYKHNRGLVTGIFGDQSFGADVFRRALQLYGRARQPLPAVSASSGAGVYVADSLFQSMSTKLRVAHHQKLSGLAATFLPSKQLQLI